MNKLSVILLLLWTFLIFFTNLFGSIEGRFSPVVSDFSYYPMSNGADINYIFGSFEKQRDCNFERIRWYIEDSDGRRARIGVSFDSEILRHQGRQYFGPWGSIATINQLMNRSVVYVDHSCHPFWYTTTRIQ